MATKAPINAHSNDAPAPLSLMKKTHALIQGKDLLVLYAETKINYFWLRKFQRNEFPNPGVNRVQFLYEHLSKKALKV